ncbi:ABC transporter ATP-binding protein [Hoeflea poritis]|uniref:ABC transporter ATP-binding protein n=1 Tax=Hoeflea poritis TaxID=2993659 RepID=A0ABT4VRF7_9HYPH|nr:ABC transporter ATP-binding protein [Hoeflea poritis]MDA4847293.1 ABC transporter ATP-binding protein [Hoeflea poritis]
MHAPAPVLEVSGLSHRARNGDVLIDDISFAVSRGSILAIAGPNGAGKSTLLRLISGLGELRPGQVRLNGRDLSRLPARERAKDVAFVGQLESPDGRLRLEDYVALGRLPLRGELPEQDHRDAVANALRATQMERFADAPFGRLSGGERQRAHIARAIAQNPKLLFLDEPTNHLDPDAKGKILSLIVGLGITVVLIVHEIALIPEFATQVAVLEQTRLRAFGSADDVLTPQLIRDVFGVELIQVRHPSEARTLSVLDIPISRNTNH